MPFFKIYFVSLVDNLRDRKKSMLLVKYEITPKELRFLDETRS